MSESIRSFELDEDGMFYDRRPYRGEPVKHGEDSRRRLHFEHYVIALIWLASVVIGVTVVLR